MANEQAQDSQSSPTSNSRSASICQTDEGSAGASFKRKESHSSSNAKIKDFTKMVSRKDSVRSTRRRFAKTACLKRMLDIVEWYEDIEVPPPSGGCTAYVESQAFENISSFIIVINCVYTAYASDWAMRHVGEPSPGYMMVSEILFMGFYTLELALRMETYRWHFFAPECIKWHMFDVVLVCLSIWDLCMSQLLYEGGGGGGNISFMRMFRLLKLAKIIRTFRVMKVFKDLAVILESFKNSFAALFWCFVMLAFKLYVFALIFLQGMTGYLEDEGSALDLEKKEDVLGYFGCLSQTMLSLYMAVTGGMDWGEVYFIVARAGTTYAILFLFYTFFFIFAVVNILTGVFVEKAVCAAQPDMEARVLDKRKESQALFAELFKAMEQIDTDQNGTISRKEFQESMRSEFFSYYLSTLGLDVLDAELFFDLLAGVGVQGGKGVNEDTQVDIHSFVDGCINMSGSATSVDMQRQLAETHEVQKRLMKVEETFCDLLRGAMEQCTAKIDAMMARIAPAVPTSNSNATVASTARVDLVDQGVGTDQPLLGLCSSAHTKDDRLPMPHSDLKRNVASGCCAWGDVTVRSTEDIRKQWDEIRQELSTQLAPQLASSVAKLVEPQFQAFADRVGVVTKLWRDEEGFSISQPSQLRKYDASIATVDATPKVSVLEAVEIDRDHSDDIDSFESGCPTATSHAGEDTIELPPEAVEQAQVIARANCVDAEAMLEHASSGKGRSPLLDILDKALSPEESIVIGTPSTASTLRNRDTSLAQKLEDREPPQMQLDKSARVQQDHRHCLPDFQKADCQLLDQHRMPVQSHRSDQQSCVDPQTEFQDLMQDESQNSGQTNMQPRFSSAEPHRRGDKGHSDLSPRFQDDSSASVMAGAKERRPTPERRSLQLSATSSENVDKTAPSSPPDLNGSFV